MFPRPGFAGPPLPRRHVRRITGTILEADPSLPRRFFGARWSGWWRVREGGVHELRARGAGRAFLKVDGIVVASLKPGGRTRGAGGPLSLEAGIHTLQIEYETAGATPFLKVLAARPGRPLRPLDPEDLFPEPPSAARLRAERGAALLGGLASVAWLGVALLAAAAARSWQAETGRPLREWPPVRAWRGRFDVARSWAAVYVFPLLVVATLALATVLRLQALAHRAQEDRPYEGDPYTYLQFAREMRGFYDAHVREPLFVAATKAGLAVAGQRDVGISFVSAFFSSLTALATYLLGARAFSRPVGLLAALFLAVESQVIGLSVEGWRDDAFAFFVVLSAHALVGIQERPTLARALPSGLAGAAACLTRITSLSFLLPAHAWLMVSTLAPGHRRRLKAVAISLVLATTLIAPYLINCAVAFGDPLFAVNYHTGFYRVRDDLRTNQPVGWMQFLLSSGHPYRTLERGYIGLTSYPFANKWRGFDGWSPLLGPILAASAVAGLVMWLGTAPGRLLLVILFSSLIPFAFTWDVPGGAEWRFTLHAYPFYLLAAALFVTQVAALARPADARRALQRLRDRRRTVAVALAGGFAVALAGWWLGVGLRYLRFREDIRTGEPARLEAGPRDRLFVGEGWYGPEALGNVRVRFSHGRRSAIELPLVARHEYLLTLRLDPFQFEGAPSQTVRVALNGSPVADLALQWDEARIGSYTLRLPASVVREGRNHLELQAAYSTPAASVGGGAQDVSGDRDVAFLLWYLRVEPAA